MFSLNLNSWNMTVLEFNKRNQTLSSVCQTCESQEIARAKHSNTVKTRE